MVSTRKRDYESDNSNTSSTVSRRQSTGAARKRNDSGESRDSNGADKVGEVATTQALAKKTRRLSKNSVRHYVSSPEPSETSFESIISQDVGFSQSAERPKPETPSTIRRSRRVSNSSDSGVTTPIQSSKRVRSSNSASSSPSKDLIDVKQFTRKSIRDGSKEAADLLSPIKESPIEYQLFEEITTVSTPPKLDGGRRSSDSNKKGTKPSPAQASIDKKSKASCDATPNNSEPQITELSQADKKNDHSITVESEHLSGITEVKEEPKESEIQMINPPPVIVTVLEPKLENEDPIHNASVLPSGADVMRNIPRGKPKSGRPWKEIKTNARNMYQDKGAKVGLEKAMKLKRELQLVKGMERRIKEERVKKFEDLKKRQEDNKQRREANERRGEVTQVVSAAKVKRMKKKQLKLIQKRDTTKVV